MNNSDRNNNTDDDCKGNNKSMGACTFDVGAVLGARGQCKAKKLATGGTLICHIRKSTGTGLLRLQMSAEKLKNTEGFGLLRKSDPFFELSRQVNSAGSLTWDNVFRSNVVKNNLNPEWNSAAIPLSTLCGGDLDAAVRVTIFDHESKGDHVLMGMFETTTRGLVNAAASGGTFTCNKSGNGTGTIKVLKADVCGAETEEEQVSERMAAAAVSAPAGPPSFLDYVSGGLELNVVVAIDFTGSNGDPRQPGTLHHIDKNSMNPYEKAISAIIPILSKYDADQKFPVLGFGAKYNGVVHHAFQCGDQPEVHGVQGVLDAYQKVFSSGLIMSSPTDITHVMEQAAKRAKDNVSGGKQAYTILLIITDGAVSDVQATADTLARISDAPLSIVIVGVGSADFSAMQFLDDANASSRRDIAQFVEFNKHSTSSVSLSSATLQEIPHQVVSYFQSKGVQPHAAVTVEEADIVVEEQEEEIDLSLDIGEGDIKVSGGGVTAVQW